MASDVRLNDAPVFRHRGLMLDTARNFLPLRAIQRTLDAMAACKLNVLHWHATDSQSFPLELPRVPQLSR
jgi:hexosaminidase